MADFHTTSEEENLISSIIRQGLEFDLDTPKYIVIRIALALALRKERIPLSRQESWKKLDKKMDNIKPKEYHLAQITNKGKGESDFDNFIKMAFFINHKDELESNIFQDDEKYLEILAKYIHRGFVEIYSTYKNSDCFYQWLLDNLATNDSSVFDNLESTQNIVSTNIESPKNSLFKKIQDYYRGFNIDITLHSNFTSYRNEILKVQILDSTKLKKFEAESENLPKAIGVESALIFPCNNEGLEKTYSIQIPISDDKKWQELGLSDFKYAINNRPNDYELGLFSGFDINKKPFYIDLAIFPHLFVAGKTGGGKSVLLRSLILYLLKTSDIEICVFDCKNAGDFDIFANTVHLENNREKIANNIKELMNLMQERQALVKNGKTLKRMVIVIDEFHYLIDKNKHILEDITNLARVARSARMHLILCTQSIDKKTLGSQLLNNIDGRISLKVTDRVAATTIQVKDAEKLQGKGDMIVKTNNGDFVRVLGVNLTKEMIISIL